MRTIPQFITLEGAEGVGKTSNAAFVAAELSRRGLAVELTREPGGTPTAEALREILLSAKDVESLSDESELLLMFAARSQHLAYRIRPAIEQGKWVVCDRFTDATFAYQGAGRGLPERLIQMLADQIHREFWPGLTLLLDAPTSVAQARAKTRSAPDRIEQEQAEFFERVRNGYLSRAANDPSRIRLIDADAPLVSVQASIGEALDRYLTDVGE